MPEPITTQDVVNKLEDFFKLWEDHPGHFLLPFYWRDGDSLVMVITTKDGNSYLSDEGDTLFHLGNTVAWAEPSEEQIKAILREWQLEYDQGNILCLITDRFVNDPNYIVNDVARFLMGCISVHNWFEFQERFKWGK